MSISGLSVTCRINRLNIILCTKNIIFLFAVRNGLAIVLYVCQFILFMQRGPLKFENINYNSYDYYFIKIEVAWDALYTIIYFTVNKFRPYHQCLSRVPLVVPRYKIIFVYAIYDMNLDFVRSVYTPQLRAGLFIVFFFFLSPLERGQNNVMLTNRLFVRSLGRLSRKEYYYHYII